MNIQCWFHIGSMGLITLLSKGFSRDFYSTTIWEQQFFYAQFSLWPNSHILTWLLKTTTTTITYLWLNTFFSQVMSLLFNTVSRFIISFLPRWLFSCSVVSNCWQPHWMQDSRLNCPFFISQNLNKFMSKLTSKIYNTERWTPQVGMCAICYWERMEK